MVVECAIECDGKFLIIRRPEGKHAGGLLSFDGGKVEEQDEKNTYDMLRAATKREILEELGLNLRGPLKYITSEYFVDSSGVCVINNLFHYRFDTIPEVMPDVHEVLWFAWMSKEEIKKAPNTPVWLKHLITLV